jgi:signal transduction histidine kinase
VAATLLVHLAVLLAVMLAVFLDARAGNERLRRSRVMDETLIVEWASRVDLGRLEAFCREADFVEETAVLSPETTGLTFGKGPRTRSPEETQALRAEISAMAERAKAGGGKVLKEGDALLIPVVEGIRVVESRYIRFRPAEVDLGALRTVYLVLVLGAAASIAVTVLALRFWILKPLDEVEEGAERVGRGDFSTPIPVHEGARDEIGAVASAFNGMMAELGAYRNDLEAQVGRSVGKARAAEQNLVTAQRLAAMGTLAAGIAHDINNPLGGMINAVRALRRDDLPKEKREEYLALVEEGLERVGQTVQKVLQFTPHRVAPQPFDLAAVADRALGLARHRLEKASIRAEAEMPASGLPVFGDPWELQQVVLNLLFNAADAVAERGAPGGRVRMRGSAGAGEVRLLVEDDGVGMTEEEVARAFDLFYTTKGVGEGTGLGLSMVHSILESHGGRVDIRSKKGEGTTVEVVLPMHR